MHLLQGGGHEHDYHCCGGLGKVFGEELGGVDFWAVREFVECMNKANRQLITERKKERGE
jgi:hypothetical protein